MLSEFYKSDDWEILITSIKHERVNQEGFIICEYCGKPIVAKYDCIGHHKTALTESNYIDANISLNPDNIMLLHHRCHNKLHDRLGLSYTKQVYLVYGSPCSGKTTFVRESMNVGDLVIDTDALWQCISLQGRYIKPNRLKQNIFSLRDYMIDMVRIRQGNWLNAWIIGGYPLISERERLCRKLGAREIFVDTTKQECIERLIAEPDGRNVSEWEKYINDWWEKFQN